MEIVEVNKLIAEFMGAEWGNDDYGNWGYKSTLFPGYFKSFVPAALLYHSSWDWLMPVWVKFRGLSFDIGIKQLHTNYVTRLAQDIAYGTIEEVHHNICIAIKWVNQQSGK